MRTHRQLYEIEGMERKGEGVRMGERRKEEMSKGGRR
jgi:hypothetical protein